MDNNSKTNGTNELEVEINEVQSNILQWTKIIAELCADAPDNVTRDCLQLYDPSKPTKQLKALFTSKCKNMTFLKLYNILVRQILIGKRKTLWLIIYY